MSHILSGATPFAALLLLKFLLDLRLAVLAVKWLSWLPVRSIFRENPPRLKGDWEHIWDSGGSDTFSAPQSTHSHPKIYQLGTYCLAIFYSLGRQYAFFGQINKDYWAGHWYDMKDPSGYFGVFELEIMSNSRIQGQWMGHSKSKRIIRTGTSVWARIGDTRH